MSQLSQLGEGVTLISKTHCSVQNLGLGAQTAEHWVRRTIRAGRCSLDWLIIEEVTQLDVGLWADVAELSTNRRVRFLLLGPAVQDAFGGAPVLRTLKESQLLHDLAGGYVHELTENRRSDERIFRFLQYLRVDEAEQVPLRDAVQVAREQFPMRGLPDTCLVISHAHQRPGEPAARSGGGGAAGAPRAGSRRDEPAADHAPVAGAQARGGGRARCPKFASSRCGRRASGSCWTTGSPSRPPSSCAARASATPSPTPRARG